MTDSNLKNPSIEIQSRNETNSMLCIPNISSNFSLLVDRISESHIFEPRN